MSDFEKDSDCIAFALASWANHIETGDHNLNHNDVVQRLKSMEKSAGDHWSARNEKQAMLDKLRVINDDQKAFVARLRALAKKAREESL